MKFVLSYRYVFAYCLNEGAGDGAVVEHLDFGIKGPEFKSHPGALASMFAEVTFLTRY